MHIDKRLLHLVMPVRLRLAGSVGAGLAAAGIIIGQAWLLSHIINRVFLQKERLAAVSGLLIMFGGLSLSRALFIWLQKKLAGEGAARIKSHLRTRLARHIFRLGPGFIRGQRSGEISNTLLNGVDQLEAYFSQYLPQLFLSTLIPLLILLLVFPLDLLSGLVFLFTAPLIPLFMILIGNLARSLTQKQWKSLSQMSAHFLDVLQGLTTLKIFGRSREQIAVIDRISDQFRDATMKVLRVAFLSALVLEIVGTISTAVVAVEVGIRLLYSKMLFEQALFILIIAPEFYLPMRLLGTRYHAGMEGVAAARRIFELLALQPAAPEGGKKPALNLRRDLIQFRQVTCRYPDANRPAVEDISFDISPNHQIALVGPSGAGKTTITHLLMRFLEPTGGTILVGRDNLTEIEAAFWRKQISWVSQNPYLFHTTIRENIRLANPQADDAAIIRAARQAGIHRFIQGLPNGYDTVAGERGARFSGGQIQRISLARAFLKDAPLLILDEPTSNLDPETDREIQQAIRELSRQRTVLVIAHQLNTIKHADQILFLADGRILERGTHRSLMELNGQYARMVKTIEEEPA